MRHGKANSQIEFLVSEQRTRNEILFEVINQVDESSIGNSAVSKPLGGLAILDELARLCGWSSLQQKKVDGKFVVSWTIPAIRRKKRGEAD